METNSLSIAHQQLADAISNYQPPDYAPLKISPWLAMSLLQKAIRRGDAGLAQRSAALLLSLSPERLWRRCAGIAFEDIGLGDLDTVDLVVVALAGKRYRAGLGGEWPVASFIVSKMVHAQKCRAADDLLMSCELHPRLESARHEYAGMTTPELLRLATGSGLLPKRAIALWFAAGTHRHATRHLTPRRGDPQLVFDALGQCEVPDWVAEITRLGFGRGAGMLAPFVALLHPLRQTESAAIKDDEFPPEIMIGDVPGWAYDLYSREGRRALAASLEGDSATAHWVRNHIPPVQRVKFLGGVLFRVEGGLVRRRLRWSIGDELRRQMDIECHGPHCPDATEILQLMRGDIPLLNEVRRHVC